MLQALFNLPRNVWLLGFISLVNDSASEMLYPLVPLYLTSVLGAGSRALGLMEGIAEATASLLKLFPAFWSTKPARQNPGSCSAMELPGLAGRLSPLPLTGCGFWPYALPTAWEKGCGLRPEIRCWPPVPKPGTEAWPLACIGPWTTRGQLSALWRPGGCWRTACRCARFFAGLLFRPSSALAFPWVCANLKQLLNRLLRRDLTGSCRACPGVQKVSICGRAFYHGQFVQYVFAVTSQRPRRAGRVYSAALDDGFRNSHDFSIPLTALSDRLGRTAILTCGYIAYGLFYVGMSLVGHSLPALFALFAFYGLFLGATEGWKKPWWRTLRPRACAARPLAGLI